MPTLPKSIASITAFAEWVEQILDLFTDKSGYEAPWFRGVGDHRFSLLPSFHRTAQAKAGESDDELRAEFKRKALPMLADRVPRDDWEWYSVMQHHRAPTRLLDWSDSALVALYFALAYRSSGGTQAASPAVWALNPFSLNRHHGHEGPVNTDFGPDIQKYLPETYSFAQLPKYPIAIDPTFTHHRMLVQHSHFTLHGRDQRGLEDMWPEIAPENRLIKVKIAGDADDLDRLQQHLRILGITETSIFPDLEGLSRELRMEYQLDRK